MDNKHRFSLSALTIALSLGLISARAATYNITFDPGDPINGLATGSTLSSQYFATTGATFRLTPFPGPAALPAAGPLTRI